MTTRRGFLGAILAAAAAPAIIKAEALMPVRKIIAPPSPGEAYVENMKRSMLHTGRTMGLMIGDVLTIAGVASVDGALKQFRVTGVTHSSGVLTIEAFR